MAAAPVLIIGNDGQTSAYLARLLRARGIEVAATGIGPAMAALGIAGEIAPADDAALDRSAAGATVFAIDDGSGATDARIEAALAARPARIVHVVEASAIGDRPAARARLRTLAVARSEAGLLASNVLLQRHDSRLGDGNSMPARIIDHVRRLADGETLEPLALADPGPQDWGWTAEYVDAVLRAAAAPRGHDLVIASGELLTAAEIADHAGAYFRNHTAALALDGAAAAAEDHAAAALAAKAMLGWRAMTTGRDLVRTWCEGAAARAAG